MPRSGAGIAARSEVSGGGGGATFGCGAAGTGAGAVSTVSGAAPRRSVSLSVPISSRSSSKLDASSRRMISETSSAVRLMRMYQVDSPPPQPSPASGRGRNKPSPACGGGLGGGGSASSTLPAEQVQDMVHRARRGLGDGRAVAVRPHRLGTALQQENLTGIALDRPLDVLWAAVECFDDLGEVGQHHQLIVRNGGSLPPWLVDRRLLHPATRRRNVLDPLVGNRARGDLARYLDDHESVRGDLAADHRRAEAPAGLDRDDRA